MIFWVYEGSNFIKLTKEQRKNLKEMLCIDAKIRDDELGGVDRKMTPLEFNEMKERVEKYKSLEGEIYRMECEKRSVLLSISDVVSRHKDDVDCRSRYSGLQDRLEKEITKFYENEIKEAYKNMEEI